jgi:hypothetical protein
MFENLLRKKLYGPGAFAPITEGSKSNIPCCALLAWQVRATFA